MLKELLIEANKSLSRKKHLTSRSGTLKVSGQPSFTNVALLMLLEVVLAS